MSDSADADTPEGAPDGAPAERSGNEAAAAETVCATCQGTGLSANKKRFCSRCLGTGKTTKRPYGWQ